jgi:hypothetical protein
MATAVSGFPPGFRQPMSVIRPRLPADPITFTAAPIDGSADGSVDGSADRSLATDGPPCSAAMRGALEPILAAPARLLADYRMERPESALYAIVQTARRLRDTTDRVLVSAGAGESAAVRAVLTTCCHPLHDHLPRAERGGRPRLAFTGDRFDNDRDRGLLDLLAPVGRPPGGDLLDRWSLIAIAPDPAEPAAAAATRLFLAALLDGVGGDVQTAAARVATVGGGTAAISRSLAVEPFPLPAELEGEWCVFTAATLLPAAIVGIDVVRLLEGAVAMNMRFSESPPEENPVRAFVAARPADPGGRPHALIAPDDRLAAVRDWFAHVQGGNRWQAASVTQLRVAEPRRDRLHVPPDLAELASGPEAGDGLPLEPFVGASWPDLAMAGEDATSPTIHLPRVDEHSIGQLLQMLMLAARLAGPSPAAGPCPPPLEPPAPEPPV